MNSIKNEYNPLSIEHQVRRRIEQRSSGVSLPDQHQIKVPSRLGCPAPSSPESQDGDLSVHFLNLLFPDAASPVSAQTTDGSNHVFTSDPKKTGTNTFFCPLKKQEESNSPLTHEKKDFSFVIENAEAGSVTLNGSWTQGVMKVQLQISQPLEVQQKQVLIAILKKKLSHELGVHMEIEID